MFCLLAGKKKRTRRRANKPPKILGTGKSFLSRILLRIWNSFWAAIATGILAGIAVGPWHGFATGFVIGAGLGFLVFLVMGRKKKRKARKSWYWGNDRWRSLRDYRKNENSTRYGLPEGTCKCERCQKIIKGTQIHLDHIWARKTGGAIGRLVGWLLQYSKRNTQILCASCNRQKSNRRDGHNWRRLRQLRLHPIAALLRSRQYNKGIRRRVG